MSDTRTALCDHCRQPLVRIDFYGRELLDGCVVCNSWTEPGGSRLWRRLPDADIEALKGLMRPRLVAVG